MSKREDIRITKSKRDLRNALTEMMLTTPFEKITVGEICEKAMVNRMTFYKHYADKYELMNDLLLKIKQSIKTRIEISSPSASIENNTMEFTFWANTAKTTALNIISIYCLRLLRVRRHSLYETGCSTTPRTQRTNF